MVPAKLTHHDAAGAAGGADGADQVVEVGAYQDHVGAFAGDVGARSHRDADIGPGEGRCVVDAVPDHREPVTGGAFGVDRGQLFLGQ